MVARYATPAEQPAERHAIVRAATLILGAGLVALAFAAATRVADTREGLVAEVITLLAALVGVGLLMYGLTARRDRPASSSPTTLPRSLADSRPRTWRDLVFGLGGVVLAVLLLTGLAFSGGALWAVLGLVLLLPMIAGCVYLCFRFLRANP